MAKVHTASAGTGVTPMAWFTTINIPLCVYVAELKDASSERGAIAK